jgi:pyruvate,water dikinase
MTSDIKFIDPHEPSLEIPGTEGWREMYPFHATFSTVDPERRNYESGIFWYFNALHRPEPIAPFDLIWDDTRHLSIGILSRYLPEPTTLGTDYRIINGYCYLGDNKAEDPEIIEKRAKIFEERIGYYFENWQELYDEKWHKKFKGLIDELNLIHFPELPDIEDISTIREGKGLTSAHPILEAYQKMLSLAYRATDYHYEFALPGYGAMLQYNETMKTLFPGISDKSISQTTMGFDAAIFRPPVELQKLAIAAVDYGTAEVLLSCTGWEEVLSKLQQTGEGKKWLEKFETARNPWFEMSGGNGWYHTDGCWNDNLDLPLFHIKNYIEALKRGETIIKPQEEVIRERDRITDEFRSTIKSEEDIQVFDQMLGLVRLVSPWAEDHHFYCDNWFQSLFYRKVRELGEFLVKYGPLEDKEDIFFFNSFEISNVLYDAVAKWNSYLTPITKTYWPVKIKRRKKILEIFREWAPPPAVGASPILPLDPVTVSLLGITEETIESWSGTEKRGSQEITELKGIAGSPGLVEGTARVCEKTSDISTLQPGDILVAKQTSPTWAPAFGIISGAVTDQGGLFAHAAIVCREYKLPAVLGTSIGTRIIKTGDRLRVDADKGVVMILERAH